LYRHAPPSVGVGMRSQSIAALLLTGKG